MDRKKVLAVSGILLAFAGVIFTLVVVRQKTDNFTHAASPDQLEAEGGVLGGNAKTQSDSNASGGQYVLLGINLTPTPTPQIELKYPPDTTLSPITPPPFARPAYLTPVTEPTFGTNVTRVTDPSAFGGSTTIRHNYSKVSAWNIDGTLMLIGKYLLDGKTYKVIRSLPVGGEWRWSNRDPNKIFVLDDSNNFKIYNVATNTTTIVRQFSGYDEVRIGPWEGNFSNDDRYVVFAGRNGTDYTAIVYDVSSNTVISTKLFPGKWDAGIDWASISPSGKYVVINTSYCNPNCSGEIDTYDRNMNFIIQASNKSPHGDLITDTDGNDYFVYVNGQINASIMKARVDTGNKTVLENINTGGHISCRNTTRPGWCYATLDVPGYQEAFGFKLDGSGTVERFAHTRTTGSTYDTQAKGVVSRDGTKILWTSDWGYTDGSFFDYIAESY